MLLQLGQLSPGSGGSLVRRISVATRITQLGTHSIAATPSCHHNRTHSHHFSCQPHPPQAWGRIFFRQQTWKARQEGQGGQEGQEGREEEEEGDGDPAIQETAPAVLKAPLGFREPCGLDFRVPGSLAGGGATSSSVLFLVDYFDHLEAHPSRPNPEAFTYDGLQSYFEALNRTPSGFKDR